MRFIINNKYRAGSQILIVIATSFGYFLINIGHVLSGGVDSTQSSTEQASVTSPDPQNVGSLTITPTTLIQNGTNSLATVNSSTGALNYPNCISSCFFGILRTTPNTNNFSGTISNQLEAVIGVIIAIDSPERANAETNRMIVEIQKSKSEHEIKLSLGEKLADAIELGKMERAKIIAMLLGPLIGKTHTQLLAEVFAKR